MSTSATWLRSTIRVRLTLLYAAAFFLAGAALVALMYFSLGQALGRQQTAQLGVTQHLPEANAAEMRMQLERERDETLNSMLIASLIALGVVGVTAGGFGWLLAGRALHPLQQITATARRVADGGLHERIALDGPRDEIKDLADTFDAMLERLDRSFDSQRRFVANASHELRTPLTINRTLIEVALDDPQANDALRQLGTTLLAVSLRHERLIDGLLALASSEQRLTDVTPVDLADIARHVTNESRGAAHDAHVDVRTHLRPAPVTGDPVLLDRLTQNLLDNAIRYNLVEHGEVTVTTQTMVSQARLTVENTGPHIPQYAVPGLFEPFRRRLAERHTRSTIRGAGLGLSIVRSITQAHGGEVYAWPRQHGGLTVEVRLPAVPKKPVPNSATRHSKSVTNVTQNDDSGSLGSYRGLG